MNYFQKSAKNQHLNFNLLVQKYQTIHSKKSVNHRTSITKHIPLNHEVLSAKSSFSANRCDSQ